MHYGIFWLVHGVFVLTLPLFGAHRRASRISRSTSPWGTILLAVVALAISHGLSFWLNFLVRGEYLRHVRGGPDVRALRPPGRSCT